MFLKDYNQKKNSLNKEVLALSAVKQGVNEPKIYEETEKLFLLQV